LTPAGLTKAIMDLARQLAGGPTRAIPCPGNRLRSFRRWGPSMLTQNDEPVLIERVRQHAVCPGRHTHYRHTSYIVAATIARSS